MKDTDLPQIHYEVPYGWYIIFRGRKYTADSKDRIKGSSSSLNAIKKLRHKIIKEYGLANIIDK